MCTGRLKFRQTPRHTQTITHRHGHLLSDTLLQNYFGLAAPHNTPQNELIVDSWAHKQQNKQVTCISPPLATVSYHHSLYNKILANVTIPFSDRHLLIQRTTRTQWPYFDSTTDIHARYGSTDCPSHPYTPTLHQGTKARAWQIGT